MALPAIAAVIARVAVPVGRALLAAGRGVGAAAKTIGTGALDAGRAVAGSFGALPGARPFAGGVARAARATMASRPVQSAARFGQAVGDRAVNAAQGVREAVQRVVGGRGANPFGSSNPASSTVQSSAGQSWKLPGTTPPAQKPISGNQGGPSRWMQRGADLYNQTKHEAKRDHQRDLIDFNKNLAAGAEGLRRLDLKSLAHFGKAAGIGLKMIAGAASGPVGVIAAFVSFPKMVRDVTASLIENRRALGEVNATYARSLISIDRDRRARNFAFAGGTASTFKDMVKATNQLEKSLQPYAVASAVVLQKLLTVLTKIATTQSEMFKKTLEFYGAGEAVKAFEDEANAREKGMHLDIKILMMNLRKLGGDRNLPPIPPGGR